MHLFSWRPRVPIPVFGVFDNFAAHLYCLSCRVAIPGAPRRAAAQKESGMSGVITTKKVVANLGLIWREFGGACIFRCVLAMAVAALTGRTTTFLGVVMGGR
jgi:hypothetical protein